jgi:hypothetical protein
LGFKRRSHEEYIGRVVLNQKNSGTVLAHIVVVVGC